MKSESDFPNVNETASIISEWLNGVEDIFECAAPEVDLAAIFKCVATIAISHASKEVRILALDVLRGGLINHGEYRVNLIGLTKEIPRLDVEELLMVINVIGVSGDASLLEYVRPLIDHEDKAIRTEVVRCLHEFGE